MNYKFLKEPIGFGGSQPASSVAATIDRFAEFQSIRFDALVDPRRGASVQLARGYGQSAPESDASCKQIQQQFRKQLI